MKLYTWQPKGHGEQSFFVMAETEEQALALVNEKIEEMKKEAYYSDLDIDGWGTDYYYLTVAEVGEVLTHDND